MERDVEMAKRGRPRNTIVAYRHPKFKKLGIWGYKKVRGKRK
jgi:hypothetical protein